MKSVIKQVWWDSDELPCPECGSTCHTFEAIELSGDFEIVPADLQIHEVQFITRGPHGYPAVEVHAAWPTMVYPLTESQENRARVRLRCENGHRFRTLFMKQRRKESV
jgi:hypothetical protein